MLYPLNLVTLLITTPCLLPEFFLVQRQEHIHPSPLTFWEMLVRREGGQERRSHKMASMYKPTQYRQAQCWKRRCVMPQSILPCEYDWKSRPPLVQENRTGLPPSMFSAPAPPYNTVKKTAAAVQLCPPKVSWRSTLMIIIRTGTQSPQGNDCQKWNMDSVT